MTRPKRTNNNEKRKEEMSDGQVKIEVKETDGDSEPTASTMTEVKVTNDPSQQSEAAGGATTTGPEASPQAEKLTKATVQVESTEPIQVARFEKITDNSLHIKDSASTILSFGVTERNRDPYFFTTKRIGTFNDTLTFLKARLKLGDDIADEKFCLLLGTPNEQMPIRSELHNVSTPGKLGLNWWSLIETQDYINKLRFIAAFSQLTIKRDPLQGRVRTREIHQFIGLSEEAKLLINAGLFIESYFISVDTYYEYLRIFSRAERTIVPPKLDQLDFPEFQKIWHEEITPAFDSLMRVTPRLTMLVVQNFFDLVRKNVPFQSTDAGSLVAHYQQIIQVSATRASEASTFPTTFSPSLGREFISSLITAKMMGYYAEIHIEVDHSRMNIVTLMDALMAKVFCPYENMSRESVIDIDNYLARYLLPILPGIRMDRYAVAIGKPTLTYDDVITRNVNYLTMLMDSQNLFNGVTDGSPVSVMNVLSTFLKTTGTGGGWNSTDTYDTQSVPDVVLRFTNNRQSPLVPYFGRDPDTSANPTPQYQNFVYFQSMLGAFGNNSIVRRDISTALTSIVSAVAQLAPKIADMSKYLNNVLGSMNLLSWVSPITPDAEITGKMGQIYQTPPPSGVRNKLMIGSNAILSAVYLINYETLFNFVINEDYINHGKNIHHFCRQLVNRYYYAWDSLSVSKYIKRSEKIAYIIEIMSAHSSFGDVFKSMIGSAPLLEDITNIMPSRDSVGYDSDPYASMRIQALQWVDRKPELFGFSYGYYYVPPTAKVVYKSKDFYNYYSVLENPGEIYQTVDYSEMFTIGVTPGAFYTLLDNADKTGKVVFFNFPIMLEAIELKKGGNPDMTQQSPFHLDSMRSGSIKIWYQWKDIYEKEGHNDNAERVRPRYSVAVNYPHMDEKDLPLGSLIHDVVVLRKGLILFDGWHYVSSY